MARVEVLVFVLASGCSSIPDVQFVDPSDAAAPVGTAQSELVDGGDSSSRKVDGGSDAGSYHCPDAPPPREVGVCCDSRLCLNCTSNHCNKCKNEDCDGDQVCCGKSNNNNVDCKKVQSCN